MTYYNTNRISSEQLNLYNRQAESQEEQIFSIFWECEPKPFTPSEIMNELNFRRTKEEQHPYPITSIRRAMTDLTKDGKLVKMNKVTVGPYGKSEHYWKLSDSALNSTNYSNWSQVG